MVRPVLSLPFLALAAATALAAGRPAFVGLNDNNSLVIDPPLGGQVLIDGVELQELRSKLCQLESMVQEQGELLRRLQSLAPPAALVVVGGVGADSNAALSQAVRYNPVSEEWQSLPQLPAGRWSPALAVLNGFLYCLGGAATGGVYTDSIYRLYVGTSWLSPFVERSWETVAFKMPEAQREGIAVTFDNAIFLFGGRGNNGLPHGRVHRYSQGATGWVELESMPAALRYPSVFVHGSGIYIFGGSLDVNAPRVASTTVYRFEPASDTWASVNTTDIEYGAGFGRFVMMADQVMALDAIRPGTGEPIVASFDLVAGNWTIRTDRRQDVASSASGPRHGFVQSAFYFLAFQAQPCQALLKRAQLNDTNGVFSTETEFVKPLPYVACNTAPTLLVQPFT